MALSETQVGHALADEVFEQASRQQISGTHWIALVMFNWPQGLWVKRLKMVGSCGVDCWICWPGLPRRRLNCTTVGCSRASSGNLAIGNAGPIRLNQVRLHFWQCQSILLRWSEIIHAPITNHLGVAQNWSYIPRDTYAYQKRPIWSLHCYQHKSKGSLAYRHSATSRAEMFLLNSGTSYSSAAV